MFHGVYIPFVDEFATCPLCGDLLTAEEELDGLCVACDLAIYYEERESRDWPHDITPLCEYCTDRLDSSPVPDGTDDEETPPF